MKFKFLKSALFSGVTILAVAPIAYAAYGGGITSPPVTVPNSTNVVTLLVPAGCQNISGFRVDPYIPLFNSPGSVVTSPFGLQDFTLECSQPIINPIFQFVNSSPVNINNIEAYKVVGSSVSALPGVTYTVTGPNSFSATYQVEDNGPLDENPLPGIIQDPVVFVVKTPQVQGGGGGGGIVSGLAGSNINWSTYIAPIVNLAGGNTNNGTVLGASTTATISTTFTRPLKLFSRSTDVKNLQNFLISKGYLTGNLNTGYFGASTRRALIKFQKANNINPAYGNFGNLTREAVNKMIAQ